MSKYDLVRVERGDGCWNCEHGCVPNFYSGGSCPWKHDPEKAKRNIELRDKLLKYKKKV